MVPEGKSAYAISLVLDAPDGLKSNSTVLIFTRLMETAFKPELNNYVNYQLMRSIQMPKVHL